MGTNTSIKLTSSGIARTGSCLLKGLLIGTDGTNDPTVTLFDNTSAAGTEIIPTVTYDASVLGLNGVSLPPGGIHCTNGIYCEIAISEGIDSKSAFLDSAFQQAIIVADETDEISVQLVQEIALKCVEKIA